MAKRPKIINLGLPKSGTTTLGQALQKAGYAVADWRIRKGQSKDPNLTDQFVGKLMYDGYFSNGNPLSLMDEFDVFSEIEVVREGLNLWPQCDFALLAAISSHYPDAKFLLSYRDPERLVDSMARWSNLGTRRIPQACIPGLPAGYGFDPRDQIRWINGHYGFCRTLFDNDPNFLEYDIDDEDAPQKISAFLGVEIPWWGKANVNDRHGD